MPRRARRKTTSQQPARPPAGGRPGCVAAAAFLSGLVLACISVFGLTLTGRTFVFCLTRGDYIRTELEVTEIGHGDGSAAVFGVVAATGEEIRCHRVPEELKGLFSRDDPNSTAMTFEKVRGKVVPIWYARNHRSFLAGDPVQFVSEFPTRPGTGLAFGIA